MSESYNDYKFEGSYPTDYRQQKTDAPAIRSKLNLDLDNIDELANKWIADKLYAFADHITKFIYQACIVGVGGFVGLGVNQLGGVFGNITTHCRLKPERMKYYSSAHSECYQSKHLTYYEAYKVDQAFDGLYKSMKRSGIMFAVAGVLVAVTFGFKRLNSYVIKYRKTNHE
jgi:hypothetical protein